MIGTRSAGASALGVLFLTVIGLGIRLWADSWVADPGKAHAATEAKLKAVGDYTPYVIGGAITLVILAGGLFLLRSKPVEATLPPDDGLPPLDGRPTEFPAEPVLVTNPLRHLVKPLLAVAALAVVVVLGTSLLREFLKTSSKAGPAFNPPTIDMRPAFDFKQFEYKPIAPPQINFQPPPPQAPVAPGRR
jgi:hypothetical protein